MMVLYMWGSVPSSLFRGFNSLWMTQDSTPYLLIRAQDVFLRDWHAITCPMGEDCSSFLFRGPRCHFESHVSPPTLAKVFIDFGRLETLQATEGGPGRVLRGTACGNLPCGRRSLCIFRWRYLLEANLVHVRGRSLSRLRPCQIIRWLSCVVHMSKHLAFIHSFMSKFNLHMCLMRIHLTNAYTALFVFFSFSPIH